MDTTERSELSQNIRSLKSSLPRQYVERGVCRYENGRSDRRNRSADGENGRSTDEYRAERLRHEAEAASSASEENEGQKRRPGASARRFNSRPSRRPQRQLAPGEEPPLIDSIRDAAERRKREKEDFRERYEQSRSGAARTERVREKERGGSVVRDVEYFVPKLSGEDAFESKNRNKKRRRNRRPMKMWQKASITAVCLFMAFIMSIGMGVSALLNRMNFVDSDSGQGQNGGGSHINAEADAAAAAEMAGVDDTAIELPDAPVMFDADIENILLIGSDRRNKSEDGRSDAMMLLTIDRKHKKIKMTSFLRDLYVKIPNKYGSKLNTSYSVGGVNLLKATLQANLGITADKYIIIDFNAFKTVVNKIGKLNGKGGIKITVTAAEARYMCSHEVYGLFPRFSKGKGTYYMNGAEALNYARIRKIDSDFGRTKRQRKVLTEIMTELKDVGTMDLINIAYSCLEYVTTDFTKNELVGLVTEAATIARYETKQISIPIKGSYTTQHNTRGEEVLAANLSVNSQLLSKFIYDDDMTYEGNQKEIHGVYLPTLKGINNSNVTTRSDTTTTTAANSGSSATRPANGG